MGKNMNKYVENDTFLHLKLYYPMERIETFKVAIFPDRTIHNRRMNVRFTYPFCVFVAKCCVLRDQEKNLEIPLTIISYKQ
jgi:hypothetical protein